jgi:hypothetical protein
MSAYRSCFRCPTAVSITARSSSITNSFVQLLIPVVEPTEDQIKEALDILQLSPTDLRCVYCGDPSTEWDHLRPLVTNQRPTGYVTEIQNLVPACGKCNQSKGKKPWREWMFSAAQRSPANRGIADLTKRAAIIERYESWGSPIQIDFEAAAGAELWADYWQHWKAVLELMRHAQTSSSSIRQKVLEVFTAQQLAAKTDMSPRQSEGVD